MSRGAAGGGMKRKEVLALADRIGRFHRRTGSLPPFVMELLDRVKDPNDLMLVFEFLEMEFPGCLIAILTAASGEEGTEEGGIARDHTLRVAPRILGKELSRHRDDGGGGERGYQ